MSAAFIVSIAVLTGSTLDAMVVPALAADAAMVAHVPAQK
jgi:hypothetical protein